MYQSFVFCNPHYFNLLWMLIKYTIVLSHVVFQLLCGTLFFQNPNQRFGFYVPKMY